MCLDKDLQEGSPIWDPGFQLDRTVESPLARQLLETKRIPFTYPSETLGTIAGKWCVYARVLCVVLCVHLFFCFVVVVVHEYLPQTQIMCLESGQH